jgi:hypothetical protein
MTLRGEELPRVELRAMSLPYNDKVLLFENPRRLAGRTSELSVEFVSAPQGCGQYTEQKIFLPPMARPTAT